MNWTFGTFGGGDISYVPLSRYYICLTTGGGDRFTYLNSTREVPWFHTYLASLSSCCIMHLGSLLKKNQRLKVLEEDDPEYSHGKQHSRSETTGALLPPSAQSKGCSKRAGCTQTNCCPPSGQYSNFSRRTTRCGVTTCMGKYHAFFIFFTFLTNVPESVAVS